MVDGNIDLAPQAKAAFVKTHNQDRSFIVMVIRSLGAARYCGKRDVTKSMANTSGSPFPFGGKHTKSTGIGKIQPSLAKGG